MKCLQINNESNSKKIEGDLRLPSVRTFFELAIAASSLEVEKKRVIDDTVFLDIQNAFPFRRRSCVSMFCAYLHNVEARIFFFKDVRDQKRPR